MQNESEKNTIYKLLLLHTNETKDNSNSTYLIQLQDFEEGLNDNVVYMEKKELDNFFNTVKNNIKGNIWVKEIQVTICEDFDLFVNW